MIWHSGRALAYRRYRIEGFEAEPAVIVVAGADGEGQRIEQQVRGGQTELAAGKIEDALGQSELARGFLGHALFVDGEGDAGGAEALGQGHALFQGTLAVLQVDRIDHRLAAIELQRGLEHAQLGKIDHQRRGHRPGDPGDRRAHVLHLVAADEGGAQIERVRTFLHLVARHFHRAVPILAFLEFAEAARAVGVAALADREIGVFLAETDLAVERGERRGPQAPALLGPGPVAVLGQALQHGVDRGDVAHLGAAAAAHQIDPVLAHEALDPRRHLGCRQRIMGVAVEQLG